jgi:hypothetical protein
MQEIWPDAGPEEEEELGWGIHNTMTSWSGTKFDNLKEHVKSIRSVEIYLIQLSVREVEFCLWSSLEV